MAALLLALLSLRSGGEVAESLVQPTAVGDAAYYDVPQTPGGPASTIRAEGKVLSAPSPFLSELDETRLLRVGHVDGAPWILYTVQEYVERPLSEIPVFYLKAGPGKFLRFTAPAASE